MKVNKIIVSCLLVLCLRFESALAENSLYVLAARQGDLSKTMNRISDMVANVNTTAFKSESDIYNELDKKMDDNSLISFGMIGKTKRDYSQGNLISTKRQLDVAIQGDGYFMVDTPRGLRFTRGGNLVVNSEGVLVTKEGYPLLGAGGGVVALTEADINIIIREDGLVSSGPEERGQLGVFIFSDNQALIKEGEGVYITDHTPFPAEEAKVVQGMIESSNVNSVRAMTDLIEVSRNIESVKRMQKNIHDIKLNSIRTLTRQ
jgi:flagellar basal-body rod protein FlgF